MAESSREAVVRQLWLNYFNRVLCQRGVITQEEYQKLAHRIYNSQ